MLESAIQSKILKNLKKRKCSFSYKHPPSPTGIPDVYHIEKGVLYCFEVKRNEKEKPKPLQKLRRKQLNKAGAKAYVVWSWKQVKEILDGISD